MPTTSLRALAAATLVAAAAPAALRFDADRLTNPHRFAPGAAPIAGDAGAAALRDALDGVTTTGRVLIIGMHPDDQLPELSVWLSRTRHVETAYLSVTRGESGLNLAGPESGPTLGAIRVSETMNARRIDGAHQFFSRAFDFGPARTASEALATWNRDSVVAELVTTIRAFRPHVIIAVRGDSTPEGDGQHAALDTLVEHAFTSSADTARFPVRLAGAPWPVAKRYRVGPGLRIETAHFDQLSGRTTAELARAVRAAARTQGLHDIGDSTSSIVELQLAGARRARGDTVAHADASLFDGVDTSFARLTVEADSRSVTAAEELVSIADSLRATIDLARPANAVPALTRMAMAAAEFRRSFPSCAHAAVNASISVTPVSRARVCTATELDRDAAADLIRERATAALLAAAGVVVEATSDRELVAAGDTAKVTVTISNHGELPVQLSALSVHGELGVDGNRVTAAIAPGTGVTFTRRVARILGDTPWWFGQRADERYPDSPWPRDGLARQGAAASILAPNAAVPDDIRRVTDVSVLLEIAGGAVATSVGPVMFRYADARVGVQNRPLSGVADIGLRFARPLEWIPINKPFTRVMHVKMIAYTDHPPLVGIGKLAPKGIAVDRIPKEVQLEPREQHDLVAPISGMLTSQARKQFLLWATTEKSTTYQFGVQTVERSDLRPIRIERASGAYLQGVDVTVPNNLIVLYVPEGVDDLRSTLTQIGVNAHEVMPDVLLTTDLTHVSTIVIAPHALERFPDIEAQSSRLMSFVRGGGTLVIQRGNDTTLASKLLPFPVSHAAMPERVLRPDAPVTVLSRTARVLTWPNKIVDADWVDWVTSRADMIPSTADPRYQRVIEMHDPDQPANRNAILIARVGKGTIVYTALTLDQQIAGAVPGGVRLLVNLLSAGLPR